MATATLTTGFPDDTMAHKELYSGALRLSAISRAVTSRADTTGFRPWSR